MKNLSSYQKLKQKNAKQEQTILFYKNFERMLKNLILANIEQNENKKELVFNWFIKNCNFAYKNEVLNKKQDKQKLIDFYANLYKKLFAIKQ